MRQAQRLVWPGFVLDLSRGEEGRRDEARQAVEDLKARHPGSSSARLIALWSLANTHPEFAAGFERIAARARDLGFD